MQGGRADAEGESPAAVPGRVAAGGHNTYTVSGKLSLSQPGLGRGCRTRVGGAGACGSASSAVRTRPGRHAAGWRWSAGWAEGRGWGNAPSAESQGGKRVTSRRLETARRRAAQRARAGIYHHHHGVREEGRAGASGRAARARQALRLVWRSAQPMRVR